MRFKLRTLLILVTIAAFACAAPIIWRQIQLQRFKSYVDVDLQSLSESERQQFNSLANTVLRRSNDTDTFAWGPTPWFLWRNPSGGLVMLEASHLMSIPGQSSARITLLTENGKLLKQMDFSTGWRIDVASAERIDPNSKTEFLFVINSQPVIHGLDVTKQYYAILDDDSFLLRLEDSDGNSLENGTQNHMIGPELPQNFDAAKIENLKSLLAAKPRNAR